MGRDVFEGALANPETLAKVTSIDDDLQHEGYQYVASKVFEDRDDNKEGT